MLHYFKNLFNWAPTHFKKMKEKELYFLSLTSVSVKIGQCFIYKEILLNIGYTYIVLKFQRMLLFWMLFMWNINIFWKYEIHASNYLGLSPIKCWMGTITKTKIFYKDLIKQKAVVQGSIHVFCFTYFDVYNN